MMTPSRTRIVGSAALIVVLGLWSARASAAVTNFSADVATSIDMGLAAFTAGGAYNDPSACGDAAGLALLALLEKRQGADPNTLSQGYANATPADQSKMRKTTAYLLKKINDGLYSYRDGSWMMALSVYKLSGGPDRGGHPDLPNSLPYNLCSGLNKIFDRIAVEQSAGGYWCYYNVGCEDSSTTQIGRASCRERV